MSPPGVELLAGDVERITKVLKHFRWWYPPDAIKAWAEDRDEYAPLAGSPTYKLTPAIRGRIAAAYERRHEIERLQSIMRGSDP